MHEGVCNLKRYQYCGIGTQSTQYSNEGYGTLVHKYNNLYRYYIYAVVYHDNFYTYTMECAYSSYGLYYMCIILCIHCFFSNMR